LQIENPKSLGKGIPRKIPCKSKLKISWSRESNPKSLAIQESKFPWKENCKGILAIAILLLQMKNPISLDTTRLNPDIFIAKRFAPLKSSTLSSLPLKLKIKKTLGKEIPMQIPYKLKSKIPRTRESNQKSN
jgi:hypothetical protein